MKRAILFATILALVFGMAAADDLKKLSSAEMTACGIRPATSRQALQRQPPMDDVRR